MTVWDRAPKFGVEESTFQSQLMEEERKEYLREKLYEGKACTNK